ncbi:MAG: hypothetical protein JWR24_2901 [Actinoallomurus sp.]|nr:hypothetical protein [Actinoallomurus sp.]
MASPHGDHPGELRFKSPGWSFYGKTLLWSMLPAGVSVLIWGAMALSAWGGPEFKLGFLGELRGVVLGLLSAFLALGMWALLVYGTYKNWRIWHQSRRPGGVIGPQGIRFETRLGSITVPWANVEALVLGGTGTRRKAGHPLQLRLMPHAEMLRDGPVRVPAHRRLMLARLPDDVDLPVGDVIDVLRRLAGPCFDVRERDRTEPSGRGSA